jgi:hypothetical protein
VYVKPPPITDTIYPLYHIGFPVIGKDWSVTETFFDNPHVDPENLKKFISTTIRVAFANHYVKTSNVENFIAMLTADYYYSESDKAKHQEWVAKYEKLTNQSYKDGTINGEVTDYIRERLSQPIPEINVGFYYKPATKRFPKQVFVYINTTEWNTKITRSKMPLREIAFRAATKDECIANHLRSRMKYYIYEHWEILIKDEWTVTEDEKWIEELKGYVKKFELEPLPKKHSAEQMQLFHTDFNPNEHE